MNRPWIDLRSQWNTLTRRGLVRGALAVTLAASFLAACSEDEVQPTPTGWYGTWSTAPQDYNEPFPAPPPPAGFMNHTIRQVVHVSAGGAQVRVRFTNVFGKTPLVIDAAHVALSTGGSSINSNTDTVLTFSGAGSVTIPAGSELWSDPAPLPVPAQADLAVSMYLAKETPVATIHSIGLQTNYVAPGNAVTARTLAGALTRTSYFFLSGVDVLGDTPANVVVVIGDSITDGTGTTPGANNRWTDYLARRLQADPLAGTVAVLNAGIAGGRLVSDIAGPKGVDRFERDVLGQTGVTHVIILLGINDIAFPALLPGSDVTVEQMTAGLQSMIDKARAKGLKVLVGTLLPFKGAVVFGRPYYMEAFESKRQAFNASIRSNASIDGVIDFDQAMHDPADAASLLAPYHYGDHLHPGDLGARVMASMVDLSLLYVNP